MDDEASLKPEPEVSYKGKISDLSEHLPMLANPEAFALAGARDMAVARDLGLSEESIKRIFGGTLQDELDSLTLEE